jgi:hypothetical protein
MVRRVALAAALTSALAVVALSGCSAGPQASQPAPPSPPVQLSLTGTAWIGSCPSLPFGSYTLKFSTMPGSQGTVQVGTPDAGSPPRSVAYSITPTGDANAGGTLTIQLDPPWHGQFRPDSQDLNWTFVIGSAQTPNSCDFVRELWLQGS